MKPILEVQTRFTDEDSQQHLNHTAILAMIGEGRIKLLDGKLKAAGIEDLDYVLVHLDADFLGEIRHPEKVHVWGRISDLGNKSVTTEYELRRGNDVLASASCVNVFFLKNKPIKAVQIPEELRKTMDETR